MSVSSPSMKTLNISPLNADTRGDSVSSNLPLTPAKSHECPTPQAHRHLHLRRPVCREAQDAARESRAERGRTGGKERHSEANTVCLGINGEPTTHRTVAKTSGCAWGFDSDSHAAKIIFKKIAEFCNLSVDKCSNLHYVILITLEERNVPRRISRFKACLPKPSSVITRGR